MTTLPDPPAPLMAEVPIARVRAGEERPEPLWVVFEAAFGVLPAALQIATRWDGHTFRQWDRYTVEGVSRPGNVTTVRLRRDQEKLDRVPPGGDRTPVYEVSVVGDAGWCTCRGFTLANHGTKPCKHLSACAFVAASGGFNPTEVCDEQAADEPDAGGGGAAGPVEAGGDREADRLHQVLVPG